MRTSVHWLLVALLVAAACLDVCSAVGASESKRRHVHNNFRRSGRSRKVGAGDVFVHLRARAIPVDAGNKGHQGASGTIFDGSIEDKPDAKANGVVLRKVDGFLGAASLKEMQAAAAAAGVSQIVFKTVVLDRFSTKNLETHEELNLKETKTLKEIKERLGAAFPQVSVHYFGAFQAECVKSVGEIAASGSASGRTVTLNPEAESKRCLYLAFADGGDSIEFLRSAAADSPVKRALSSASAEKKTALVKKMATVLRTMHTKGVIHGDALSGNIVYKTSAKDGEALTSGDFRFIDFAYGGLFSEPPGANEAFRELALKDLKDSMSALCGLLSPKPSTTPFDETINTLCDRLISADSKNKGPEVDVLALEAKLVAGSFEEASNTLKGLFKDGTSAPAARSPFSPDFFNVQGDKF